MGPRINSETKPMTAQQIDKVLSKLKPLKFPESVYKHSKKTTIDEFIIKFFELNRIHGAYPVGGGRACDRSRLRSMVDVYRVCKFYYPKTSIKDVARALHNAKTSMNISFNICSTVRRRVFDMYECKAWNYQKPGFSGARMAKDEFGLDFNQFIALKDS